jgi:amidase
LLTSWYDLYSYAEQAIKLVQVNALTEIFFDQALARAKDLDAQFSKTGKPVGPLHGLPISLKDSLNIKGVHTTVAYVAFLSHPPADQNSALVTRLLESGAILYVKTNIPQTMMTADSDNPLFGRTLNPTRLNLTAGGSTGGEGALISFRGSLLGGGTDVAGSVRIPSLANGIYGFKPTSNRVPFAGQVPPGRNGSPSPIMPAIGPEAHSVRDLELFLKTVLGDGNRVWELDPGVLNIPWRELPPVQRKLRFGLLLETPKRPLHPTILRSLTTAVKLLEGAGHSVVSLDERVPDLWESNVLSWKFFLLDPKRTPAQIVKRSGEPWVPSIATMHLDELNGREASLDELWDLNVERAKVVKAYHDLFVDEKLDAIITPAYQATAVPHDTYGHAVYTVLWNLLNYPAAAMPFLKAEKAVDKDFVRDVAYEPPCESPSIPIS